MTYDSNSISCYGLWFKPRKYIAGVKQGHGGISLLYVLFIIFRKIYKKLITINLPRA